VIIALALDGDDGMGFDGRQHGNFREDAQAGIVGGHAVEAGRHPAVEKPAGC